MEKLQSPVTGADLGKHAYREQYGVIVICSDETGQKEIYNKLAEEFPNNKIRVVTT